MIATVEPFARWLGSRRIAFQPAVEIVVVKLLAPQDSGQCLAHDVLAIRCDAVGNNRPIKLLRFGALLCNLISNVPLSLSALAGAVGESRSRTIMVSPDATVET